MTFEQWMNRPVTRVHVATGRLHNQFTGRSGNVTRVDMDQPIPDDLLFRAKPQYRTPTVTAIRRAVAIEVRAARLGGGRIRLPRYNPATTNYE